VDAYFEVGLHDVYNRWEKDKISTYMISEPSDLEYTVDSFELVTHGQFLEEKPETGRNYRALNDEAFRKVVVTESSTLPALEKRTWHSLRVWDGAKWTDSQFWYRGTDTAGIVQLGHLATREHMGLMKQGRRIYQGNLIDTAGNAPPIHMPVTIGSTKYTIIQGRYVAGTDEWNNLHLFEVSRDVAGITFDEARTDTMPSFSLPGGNYSFNSGGGGSDDTGQMQYEFASGVNGSSYEVQGFSLNGLSGMLASGVNLNLTLFQDTTRLNYPMGYTIDFGNNEIIPTYDFENSVLELFYAL